MGRRTASQRDGRTTNTRARILQLAEEFYNRGGYAGIGLADIAGKLGITKAALFHHFKSKQVLFFEMLLRMLEQRHTRIEESIATELGTTARLRAILWTMAECPFFDPMKFMTDEQGKLSPEQQREIEAAFHRAMQEPIMRVLSEGIARGELRPHRPMLGTMVFLNLMMLLPSPGHPTRRALSVEELPAYIDELLMFFLAGVVAGSLPKSG